VPPHDVLIEFDDEIARADRAGVDLGALRDLLRRTLAEDAPSDSAVMVLLGGDELLQRLNLAHRGVDAPTDVLSFEATADDDGFPAAQGDSEARYLGDIAISVETVRRQAAEAGLTAAEELAHVALHGLLHLLGYDHESEHEAAAMRAREEAALGTGVHAGRPDHDE
jgi:probable rRNA maturation factor